MQPRPRVLQFIFAITSGLLLCASFPPIGWWPCALLGIAFLVLSIDGLTWFGSFFNGTIAGLAFFVLLFGWVRISSGLMVAPFVLGLTQAIAIGVTATIWQGLSRVRVISTYVGLRAPAFAIVWIGCEQLRCSFPWGGMPWGQLGFSQVDGPLVRLAPWGSTQLVGLSVVVIGVLLAHCFRSVVALNLGRAITSGTVGALLVCGAIFVPLSSSVDSYLNVAFVQGQVPDSSVIPDWHARSLAVTQNLAKASQSINGAKVDVVLWPESASDVDFRTDNQAGEIVAEAAERLGVPLILGTQRFEGNVRYNEYVVVEPGFEVASTYAKQHPVPFGEYMPHREFFRKITNAVDQVGTDMAPGDSPAVIDVGRGEESVRFASPICFEVGDDSVVAEAVKEGAQLIVVPTNNASFGRGAESRQQFDMTRFRAVEHGRTAIQVSTVGVSGIVEPNGSVHSTTPPWVQAVQTSRVGLRSSQTIATKYHVAIQVVSYGGTLILTALGLVGLARNRRIGYVSQQTKGER